MPSPLAHGALALLATPALARPAGGGRLQRLTLWGLVLLFLGLPDLDILVSWALTGEPFLRHGGPSHSLLLAPLAGVVFAMLAAPLCACGWRRRMLIGTLLYASHVVMDAATNGRGVALLWPLSADRILFPWTPFEGLHHSQWRQWPLHLRTLVNEGVFVGVVVAVRLAWMWIRSAEARAAHGELHGGARHAPR